MALRRISTHTRALYLAGALVFTGSSPALAAESGAPPAPADQAMSGPAAKPAVMIPGVVTRARFTHDIRDLEPVDTVSALTNDQTRIVYFTEIHGMAGETVTHRWEHNGKVIMEVPIKVGTSRWRAYSTKTLLPSWTGEWKASVVDAAGGTLSVNTFTYLDKSGTPTSVATTPAP